MFGGTPGARSFQVKLLGNGPKGITRVLEPVMERDPESVELWDPKSSGLTYEFYRQSLPISIYKSGAALILLLQIGSSTCIQRVTPEK